MTTHTIVMLAPLVAVLLVIAVAVSAQMGERQ